MSEQVTTEQFREQLSALMDGELPRDQLRFLLRRIDADTDLPRSWSRYQLTRIVLRRQIATPVRADFADALMQRIAQESIPSRRRGGVLLRWAGGGAIAAAVAVVALVTTRPTGELQTQGSVVVTATPTAIQDAHVAQSPPIPALLNFDYYTQPASFDSGPVAIPRDDVVRRRYETYAGDSKNGGMPYVLLTAPPRPPQQGAPERLEKPQQ